MSFTQSREHAQALMDLDFEKLQILPCPFCGHQIFDPEEIMDCGFGPPPSAQVWCSNCGCRGPNGLGSFRGDYSRSIAEAIKNWNSIHNKKTDMNTPNDKEDKIITCTTTDGSDVAARSMHRARLVYCPIGDGGAWIVKSLDGPNNRFVNSCELDSLIRLAGGLPPAPPPFRRPFWDRFMRNLRQSREMFKDGLIGAIAGASVSQLLSREPVPTRILAALVVVAMFIGLVLIVCLVITVMETPRKDK